VLYSTSLLAIIIDMENLAGYLNNCSFRVVCCHMQGKNGLYRECVNYALEHNISIKQTELDGQTAPIDKRGAFGRFLPSLNAN
jgi:hypothetical protein